MLPLCQYNYSLMMPIEDSQVSIDQLLPRLMTHASIYIL